MSIKVIKRDGIIVEFDIKRIINAIYKANLETNELVAENIEEFKEIPTIKKIINNINQWCADETELSVEKIQDTVEQSLIKYGLDKTAKAYILYRNKRAQIREGKLNISSIIRDLIKIDSSDNEVARENGNINSDSTMGSMLKIGSETSKWFNLREVIRPKHAVMHISGDFHINDLDFYSLCTNCMQIPFDKLLKNGFSSGHGFIRPPSNIISAAALVAVIFQASQNEFFGGQGCHALDFFLAPYVKKTFIKELINLLEINLEDSNCLTAIKQDLEEYSKDHSVLDCKEPIFNIIVRSKLFHNILYHYIELANKRTDKATYQAMEALIHNLCTLQSRSGSQTVFSSINFGMDTTPEGRMVSKNLMLAQEAGLGNGETAIFPITIMSLMEGYNLNEGDPNYDLFKLACKVSAKRLYPNFNNIGSTWNKPYFKPGDYNTITSVMGALSGNEFTVVYYEDTGVIETVKIKEFINRFNTDSDIFSLSRYMLEKDWIKAHNVANTYFHNVTGIKIYDGKKFVNLKKVMYWEKPNSNWYKVSYTKNHTSSFAYNTDLPEALTTHELIITHDHPLCVLDNTEDSYRFKYKRVLAEDIYKNVDKYSLVSSNCGIVSCYIPVKFSIEKLDSSIDYAYDFETESDKFIVGARYTYDLTEYIVSHNCRTRVIGNVWNADKEITPGRGNLSFSTLNLPRLGIEAHGNIDKFFKDLDSIMNEMIEQLLDRYKVQANRRAKNFPFAVQEGIFLDSEQLGPDDKLGDTIRHGTLTIGYCGLAECLVALIGKHHGESDEAQALGLRIIKFMRDKMDRVAQETKYNFSLMGAPAESTAGKFARLDQKKYGIIPGVTDKEYYTNSSHVPPAYNCTMKHKIDIEAPYHKLCNAGLIYYGEYDGDPLQNLDAFEAIVKYACKKDMGYIAISHDVDRCPVCHYVGIINDTCPRCGRTEDTWPSRETLVALKKVYKNIEIPDWLE